MKKYREVTIMFREIIDLGRAIDELDIAFGGRQFDGINLAAIIEIEENITELQKQELMKDELIPFKYTISNYYAVLMELARLEFDEVQRFSTKLQQWANFNEADLDIKIERIKLYRQAIELYDSESKINTSYIAQIFTNLGNLYHEMGRIVESIEVLSKTHSSIDRFPMALGNYAIKCYTLSNYCIDETVKIYLLKLSFSELSSLLESDINPKFMAEDQINLFKDWEIYVKELIKNKFSSVDSWKRSTDVGSSYKIWCSNNQFSLNYINVVSFDGNIDNLHIPNMGISYFGDDNGKMTYYSWFNTIKQEFNTARYNLYLTNLDKIEVHESQENNILINTLDYPETGYRTEVLKTSLRTAYGILDKIGLFCSHFFNVETPPGRIDFNKWYTQVEMHVALSSPFNALYWLSKDLDFKFGHFKNIRRLRNVVEHRYLRVLENYHVPISDELEDTNKYEYIISYKDLLAMTQETLKLVRAAIFYLVNGFNAIYLDMLISKKQNEVFMPLMLSVYKDEWKN